MSIIGFDLDLNKSALTLDRQMHQLSEILLEMIKIKIFKIINIDISHLELRHLTFQKLGHLSCQDF